MRRSARATPADRSSNAAGEVVGINTAVAASNGQQQASNIGFVIPTANAMAIAEDVIAGS